MGWEQILLFRGGSPLQAEVGTSIFAAVIRAAISLSLTLARKRDMPKPKHLSKSLHVL